MAIEVKTLPNDFLELQKDLPILITKDATNPFFKSGYLSLPKLLETVLPIINKHNFSLIQHPTIQDGLPVLKTVLLHVSGGEITSTMLLFVKSNDPQSQGSATSYARRYAITAILGLAAEDDDGQSATQSAQQIAHGKTADTAQFDVPTKIRAMFAVVKDLGVTDAETAKSAIKAFADVKSLNDMTYSKASEVLENLKKMTPEKFAIFTQEVPF